MSVKDNLCAGRFGFERECGGTVPNTSDSGNTAWFCVFLRRIPMNY